jgi:hypothetical protein
MTVLGLTQRSDTGGMTTAQQDDSLHRDLYVSEADRRREQYGKIVDSVFSATYKKGVRIASENYYGTLC